MDAITALESNYNYTSYSVGLICVGYQNHAPPVQQVRQHIISHKTHIHATKSIKTHLNIPGIRKHAYRCMWNVYKYIERCVDGSNYGGCIVFPLLLHEKRCSAYSKDAAPLQKTWLFVRQGNLRLVRLTRLGGQVPDTRYPVAGTEVAFRILLNSFLILRISNSVCV